MPIKWQPNFDNGLPADLIAQCAAPDRITFPVSERTGRNALRLSTQPGDTNIAGSGTMLRCDTMQAKPGTMQPLVYYSGTQWWAFSVMFPDDAQLPAGPTCVFNQFHNYPEGGHAANVLFNLVNWNGDNAKLGQMQIQRFFGDIANPTERHVTLGMPQKGVWYDYLVKAKWSPGADGQFQVWLNGRAVMDDMGPTLYKGYGIYYKPSLYHSPFNELPNAVVHDRIRMGTTRESVE